MSPLNSGSRRALWLALGFLGAGLAAPSSRAGAREAEQVLQDRGLTRVGPVYLLQNEDDLAERIAEVRKLSAENDQIKARLAEDLATLGRAERRYQEVLQRQQVLETEWQAGSQDHGDRPASPPPSRDGTGPPPPPGGFGPGPQRPPPPRGRDPFSPRGSKEFGHRMPPEELGRQYENLQIERGTLEVKIVLIQRSVDELAERVESTSSAIERGRTVTIKRFEEIKARYAALGTESDVARALAAVNATGTSRVALGPRPEDSKDLQTLANDGLAARAMASERRGRVELKGMSRLTALAGAAEALHQELAIAARRIQEREHDADYRQKMIDQVKPGESPARVEKLRTEAARA